MFFLSIKHTSAALTLNENYDPSVRTDMTMALDTIVPESLAWEHTDEGPDDSVSHTKAALIGTTTSIPVTNGKLSLGTWQGIYLCEFREDKQERSVVATCIGE
jgi:secondary thiamine-phosphate synthase enzyme